MWTTGTLLASGLAALLAVGALPTEWADDAVLTAVAGLVGFAGIVGWARWEQLERDMLAAFGWSGE